MITACILGGVLLAGLRVWKHRIDTSRRSAVFIVNEGLERWLVDFTTGMMYYRHFYKVPHQTDRNLGLDYEILPIIPSVWRWCGVPGVQPTPLTWKMRLTKESHDLAHRGAVDRLLNPSGLSDKSRNRVRKETQLYLLELGPEPTWKPVPHWLVGILNSRYEVFFRYKLAGEEGVYENHPGRVEGLERYLTRDWRSLCSNGSKGGSRPKRYLKIYGTASSTAERRTVPKERDSHALIG